MSLPGIDFATALKFRSLYVCAAVIAILGSSLADKQDAASLTNDVRPNQPYAQLQAQYSCLIGQNLYRGGSSPRRRAARPKRTLPPKKTGSSDKRQSVVGLDLHCLATDGNDNVWAGGSVFLERGLLLRYDGMRINPTTLADTWTVTQLSFTSRDWGWLIADRYELYGTIDGGKSWRKTALDLGANPPNLETLYFSDPENGWVGGWRGVIFHTNDAGRSWTRQNSSTNLDIKRLKFVNRLHGWAYAWKSYVGSFLTTIDGGVTWKKLPSGSNLYDFTFVDDFEGWGLDDRGITHTVDGGETWTSQGPDDASLRLIFFLNNQEGWVVGADALLRTANGGQTWSKVNEEKLPFNPVDVLFTDSQHGWAAQEFGANLFRTNDGGKTWEPVSQGWQTKIANEVARAVFPAKQ